VSLDSLLHIAGCKVMERNGLRRSATANPLTRDEIRTITANIAKL
jgi:hypothetical protein